jgi:hypothetical protein
LRHVVCGNRAGVAGRFPLCLKPPREKPLATVYPEIVRRPRAFDGEGNKCRDTGVPPLVVICREHHLRAWPFAWSTSLRVSRLTAIVFAVIVQFYAHSEGGYLK